MRHLAPYVPIRLLSARRLQSVARVSDFGLTPLRVACACRALLHGSKRSVVLIHDYDRQIYHVIEKVADVVKKVGLIT